MTTNTTNSQAASIEKDDEFEKLLSAHESATTDAHICGGDFGTGRKATAAYNELIAYIDAKLAQAHLEKQVAEMAAEVEARDRDQWKARATAAESRLAIETKWATDMQIKAVALTDRLAEIQRGVEGLTRYGLYKTVFLQMDDYSIEPDEQGAWLDRDAVLALLQPQGQADTSGLPG